MEAGTPFLASRPWAGGTLSLLMSRLGRYAETGELTKQKNKNFTPCPAD